MRPSLPPPRVLGLPARFRRYRQQQCEMVNDSTEDETRATICNAPTGVGKTLIPPTVGKLEDKRVLVLTATKLLQDVYAPDDPDADMGFSDVRGANNYPCPALEPGGQFANMRATINGSATADKGPCLVGHKCHLKEGGCPRYDAIRKARESQLVVTNYDCWLAQGRQELLNPDAEVRLGQFDYIFLDELHSAMGKVSDAVRIELNTETVHKLFDGVQVLTARNSIPMWVEWATQMLKRVSSILKTLRKEVDEGRAAGRMSFLEAARGVRELTLLTRTLGSMKAMGSGWVVDSNTVRGAVIITFEPVWPAPYCEPLLYRGIPRVVGMSATIRPPALTYIGLRERDYIYHEYDSPFDPNRAPIWQWPAVQLNYQTEQQPKTQRLWAETIDRIRTSRSDGRRGLGHAVSYKRMLLYERLTKLRDGLMTHTKYSLREELQRFENEPNAFFVSPSVDTGYDFADAQAEYGVVMKTPYPSMDSEVMRARVKQDRKYPSVYAADKLIQTCGRIVRNERDKGENFIIDSVAGALFKQYELFPKWFRKRVRFVRELPPRPGKWSSQ